MSEPKDTTSFFRKVVKFVANPTTEWAELGVPAEEVRETEYAKGELKAMIERKRRNDFVRKREFDMLRKVRREGLTSEQLAALGGSSRIDDSEARIVDSGAKADIGVKAKIDEIEQQMVGDASFPNHASRRTPEFYNAPTEPAAMDVRPTRATSGPINFDGAQVEDFMTERALPMASSPVVMSGGVSPLTSIEFDDASADLVHPFAQELSEIAHDPELDEAVIAFANADFEQCEQALSVLTGLGGARAQHAETWLVLFDLYRAIGQQHKFEPGSRSTPSMGLQAPTKKLQRPSRVLNGSAGRGSSPLLGGCTPPDTAAARGPSGSSPASATPSRPTSDTR